MTFEEAQGWVPILNELGWVVRDVGLTPDGSDATKTFTYTSEMERELEPASAELEQQDEPEPAHPVETVTEKPVNPRRGWWQRLIQS